MDHDAERRKHTIVIEVWPTKERRFLAPCLQKRDPMICIDSARVPVVSQRVLNKTNGFGEGCKRFSEIRTWQPQYRLQNTVTIILILGTIEKVTPNSWKPVTEGVDFQGNSNTGESMGNSGLLLRNLSSPLSR